MTTVIWGTSFPLLKDALQTLPPAALMAVRFSIAAAALLPWLRSPNVQLWRDGLILGFLLFAESGMALMGLESISANRSAFIISLNVILVPLISGLFGQRLSQQILMAAVLAIAGVGMLSWEGGGVGVGDWLTLGAALGISVYVLVLGVVTHRHPTQQLVAVQVFVMAVLSLIWAAPEIASHTGAIANHFGALFYLAIVVTATPTWTQAIAQRAVPAHEAALLYTLEPVFATFFSFLLLGEQLGPRGMVGAAIVLSATVFSQLNPGRKQAE